MPHLHVYHLGCCYFLFFEGKESPQRREIWDTVVSLLQVGNCTKGWKRSQDFCGGTKNQSPASAQLCYCKALPHPLPFCGCTVSSVKVSCKKAGLASQTSVKRGTEMDTLWVCYSLHTSLVESYSFSEPRNWQLAMQGVEEHDPGMF